MSGCSGKACFALIRRTISAVTICFLLSAICLPSLYADEEDPSDTAIWETDSDIEAAFEDGDITEDQYDRFTDLYENKIDINTADTLELTVLPNITSSDAERIVEYRLKHGPYKRTTDLVHPDALTSEQFDRIRLFVTAEAIKKVKIKGKLLLRNKSFSSVEADTTDFLRSQELIHLKIDELGKHLRFGTIVEGDARYEDFFIKAGEVAGGEIQKAYRLNKLYFGYEKGTFLKQAYIGNYRAGFGQRLVFSNASGKNPHGLYPDDKFSGSRASTFFSTENTGTGAPRSKITLGSTIDYFKGAAARFQAGRLDTTLGYSKIRRPQTVLVNQPGGAPSRFFTVPDLFTEENIGGNITYKLLSKKRTVDETSIGLTSYHSSRESSDPAFRVDNLKRYPPERAFLVYGLNFRTGLRGFALAGEWAKVSRWGQAFFIRATRKIKSVDLELSFRDYDFDFFNPAANAPSKHTTSSVFKDRDERGGYFELKLRPHSSTALKFTVDQFQHTAKSSFSSTTGLNVITFENPTSDREIFLESIFNLPKSVKLTLNRKWQDRDIFKKSSLTAERLTVTTNAKLNIKPSRKSALTLNYQYKEENFDDPDSYKPRDKITTKLNYEILPSLSSITLFEWEDKDLRSSGNESRLLEFRVTNKLGKNASLRLTYSNKIVTFIEEEFDESFFTASDPGATNKWEARLEYKW